MIRIICILSLLGTVNVIAQDSLRVQVSLSSASDSMDYFFGLNMGYSLQGNPYIHDPELVIEGFIQAIEGNSKWDPNASKEILRELIMSMAAESVPQQSAG